MVLGEVLSLECLCPQPYLATARSAAEAGMRDGRTVYRKSGRTGRLGHYDSDFSSAADQADQIEAFEKEPLQPMRSIMPQLLNVGTGLLVTSWVG